MHQRLKTLVYFVTLSSITAVPRARDYYFERLIPVKL